MSPKNLVIVESPAKAKTIEKYLGSDWQVKSSFGHIRDLKKREKGKPAKEKLLVEGVTTDFEPLYQNSPEKLKVIRELKTAAKGKEV
jgi:DNA topoisomerase-1